MNKAIVTNLPWVLSRREVMDYFSRYGELLHVSTVFDKRTGLSKRHAYLTFSHKSAVDRAITDNKHVLEGSVATVHRVHENGYPEDLTDSDTER